MDALNHIWIPWYFEALSDREFNNLLFSKFILSTNHHDETKFEKEDTEVGEDEQEVSSFDFNAQRQSCERNVSFFDKDVFLFFTFIYHEILTLNAIITTPI